MSNSLEIRVVPVTPFQQNCSILWCTETMRGAVIDPGGEPDRLLEVVAAEKITLEKVLLTHGHLDHASATAELAARSSLPIEGPHPDDQFLIDDIPAQAARYGFPPAKSFKPTRWLAQGDTVTVGNQTLQVRHCPGHTPGHVVFYSPEYRFAIVGDVLFAGSIGRTDLPRGDHQQLLRSIKDNLLSLPDDVRFLPGHGPISSIGAERNRNPFLTGLT